MIGSTVESGSESRIDLRAGSIIRRKHQSKSRYLGCAPWLLLAAVLSFKFAVLAGWLVREYYESGYRCAFTWDDSDWQGENSALTAAPADNGRYAQLLRTKRQQDLSSMKRPTAVQMQPVQTSGIQLLQSVGGQTIRTKTIRNRIEALPGNSVSLNDVPKMKPKPQMPIYEEGGSTEVVSLDDDQIDRLRPPIGGPVPKVPRIVARESGEDKENGQNST
ncbi:unnamed protein product, partial [Mesorhabditis spiculigera]